jgi:hypothetical protein
LVSDKRRAYRAGFAMTNVPTRQIFVIARLTKEIYLLMAIVRPKQFNGITIYGSTSAGSFDKLRIKSEP